MGLNIAHFLGCSMVYSKEIICTQQWRWMVDDEQHVNHKLFSKHSVLVWVVPMVINVEFRVIIIILSSANIVLISEFLDGINLITPNACYLPYTTIYYYLNKLVLLKPPFNSLFYLQSEKFRCSILHQNLNNLYPYNSI